MLAVGTAEGSCYTTNMYHGKRTDAVVRLLSRRLHRSPSELTLRSMADIHSSPAPSHPQDLSVGLLCKGGIISDA